MRSKIENTTSKPGARSESLRRGLEILLLFSNLPLEAGTVPEWGVSQLARTLGLHKSQVHRAVKTLEDAGFLQKNPETEKYCLGLEALQLGVAAEEQIGFFMVARPLLRKLAEKAEASVSLRVRMRDDKILVVESAESPGMLRVMSFRGARLLWNFGAGSKVLAAFAPPGYAEEMIRKHGLTRFTERTIVDPGAYLAELDRVREQGFATSAGEGIRGSFSVAVPLLLPGGQQIAALVAATPSVGLTDKRIKALLSMTKQTAEALSRLLNNSRPPGGHGIRTLTNGTKRTVGEIAQAIS